LFGASSRKNVSQSRAAPRGFAMAYEVQGWALGRLVTAEAETAKEAFAKAVEWQIVNCVSGVTISDDRRNFTVAEFSWTMASQEIEDTMRAERRLHNAPI
jgi:hypothetical protein